MTTPTRRGALVAVVLALAVACTAGVALAKPKTMKLNLTSGDYNCPSSFVMIGGVNTLKQTCAKLTGKPGQGTLVMLNKLVGSNIVGTSTLKVAGKTVTLSCKGPIATDSQKRVTTKLVCKGTGTTKATGVKIFNQSPPNEVAKPSLTKITGTATVS